MSPTVRVTNAQLIFNELPAGFPEPGKTTVYKDTARIALYSVPLDGGILLKGLSLSIDPLIRWQMRSPNIEIQGFAIGRVLRSESEHFEEGDHVSAFTDFQEYNVIPASELKDSMVLLLPEVKDETGSLLPWSFYLGVLGMPGRTGYGAWKEYAVAKKGETVFVYSGAGAVGSFVIQLANRDGLKVIASAGSDEKVEFCRSIGADVAFNYKSESTKDVERNGPIDIFWDNIGGETLEHALVNSAIHARFLECGMMALHNNQDDVRFKRENFINIINRRIRVIGLSVLDTDHTQMESFHREIPGLVAKGEWVHAEEVTKGLEMAGNAIRDVQTGANKGKSVVWVADD